MLPIFMFITICGGGTTHVAHIVERVNAGVGQPVIQPHGVSAGREGLREGIGALGAGIEVFFQRGRIGNAGLLELIG
ncbi:Uncharacterised protein [Serratia odorifera]|uniref:Uncharacterized protein n=1 Tax=Serratia odorifera TaxID=618 RepID=A0A447KW36_SEROD|nr:Uncharacterised protein [Serratia odorifera]